MYLKLLVTVSSGASSGALLENRLMNLPGEFWKTKVLSLHASDALPRPKDEIIRSRHSAGGTSPILGNGPFSGISGRDDIESFRDFRPDLFPGGRRHLPSGRTAGGQRTPES